MEFIKRIPVDLRPEYIINRLKKPGAIYMATDYTAYESHFTAELMHDCEFQFYDHMVKNIPEARRVMKRFKKTVSGMNDVKFTTLSAKIPASRMSGEMNTSLGNGFANLMIFLFLMKELGVIDHKCVIEGDDCLARFFPSGVLSHLSRQALITLVQDKYKEFGMNVKIELHDDLCKASFCGLVFDDQVKDNLADPTKIILKLGWIHAKYVKSSQKTRRELLKGKAMSILASNPGCPIVQDIALWILRLTPKDHYRIEDNWAKIKIEGCSLLPKPIQFESRLLMEEVFGYTVEEQLSIESYFKNKCDLAPIENHIIYHHISASALHYDLNYVFPSEQEDWPSLGLPFALQ